MKKIVKLFFILFVFCTLVSCKNTPIDKVLENKPGNPADYDTKVMPISGTEHSSEISQDSITPVADNFQGKSIGKKTLGGLFEKEKESSSTVAQGKPFYDYFESKQKDFNSVNHVTMSYSAAPIDEIVPVFAKILGFDFFIDSNVKGTVTMTIDSNLSKKELWMIFEQLLLFTGSYCSLDDGIVHIQPLSLMSQERRLGPGYGYEANVSIMLFRLNNAKSSSMVQQLKPFMTNGAVLIDIPEQNSILVVETPSNMPKLKAIIGMLDTSSRAAWPKTVIRCVNVPPSKVSEELTKILPVLGLPVEDLSDPEKGNAKKGQNPGAINLQGIDRLQLLVVSAADSEVLEEIKKWVDVLDRNDVGDQDRVYVYNVLHGSADNLIQILAVIFNVTQGATLTPPTTNQQQSSSSNNNTPGTGGTNPQSSSSGGNTPSPFMLATAYDVTQLQTQNQSSAQRDDNKPKKTPVSAFDVETKIMADAINQRLIIKTAPRTYAIMKALLNRIDTIPKQVLLEIVIADVTLKNSTSIGVELKGQFGGSVIGTDYQNYETNYKPSGTTTPTTPYGAEFLYTNGNTKAFIQALQSYGKTTLLASPEILVQSNTQAKISIGQSIPVQTGSFTAGSGQPGNLTNTYDYQSTGIIINATPRITRGNLINVDFDQTISEVANPTLTTSSGTTINTTPTINQRKLTTTLILPDSGTIIIGGLIRDKRADAIQTVPFFGNIPFLSNLMGTTVVSIERNEMLVMLTAKIIKRTSDIEAMADRYKQAIEEWKTFYSEDAKDANYILQQNENYKMYLK